MGCKGHAAGEARWPASLADRGVQSDRGPLADRHREAADRAGTVAVVSGCVVGSWVWEVRVAVDAGHVGHVLLDRVHRDRHR